MRSGGETTYALYVTGDEHCRVVITAVYKKTTMPELHFFNNCFQDEFSTREFLLWLMHACMVSDIELVWKVARYTSAAPLFFTEFEDYVDGGVLANNPCSYGFSAIQNFYRSALALYLAVTD